MIQYDSFEDRFNYAKLYGGVGKDTFGFDRYLNQQFYKSKEWKQLRDRIVVRDQACDLGCPTNPIRGSIYIHHLNPISTESFSDDEIMEELLNPDNLVCVSLETHNAIHYGKLDYGQKNKIIERAPNDTIPWK